MTIEGAKVYRVKPCDFSSKLAVSACYIRLGERYLLLHRASGVPQPGTWGVPAGKLERGETPREAVIREVHEETGISLDTTCLKEVGTFYVRYPDTDFTYHMFQQTVAKRPEVHLSREHQEYRWLLIEEILELPVISGGEEALYQFLALMNVPKLPLRPFYFVRHGETDVNANPNLKRVDYDLPLNARGVQQAKEAKEISSKLPIKRIHSSPIQRATQTRDVILEALDVPHVEDPYLSECRAAIWTKMVQLQEGHRYDVCESVQTFLSQALSGVDAALKSEGTTLIVAHGGVHFALCYCLGIENHPWKIGNCEVVHFQPTETGQWQATVIK